MNEQLTEQIDAARKRVRKMDEVDGYEDRWLGTIASALKSGLVNPDNGGQFDALVMLQDRIAKAGTNLC